MADTNYDIHYDVNIENRETEIDPQGCCSISFQNLGTKTAYVFDNIPVPVNIIREFVNEPSCKLTQKIRLTWKGQLAPGDKNTEQVLVVKTFATRRS